MKLTLSEHVILREIARLQRLAGSRETVIGDVAGWVFAGNPALQGDLGVTERTISRALNRLEDLGLTERVRVRARNKPSGWQRYVRATNAALEYLRPMSGRAENVRDGHGVNVRQSRTKCPSVTDIYASSPEYLVPKRDSGLRNQCESTTAATRVNRPPKNGAMSPAETAAAVALVARGVDRRVAEELAREHGADACHNQIRWLGERGERPSRVTVAQRLVTAIRQDWARPGAEDEPGPTGPPPRKLTVEDLAPADQRGLVPVVDAEPLPPEVEAKAQAAYRSMFGRAAPTVRETAAVYGAEVVH